MEPDSLPTELILTHSRQSLGKINLDWMPQPGNYLDVEGKTYAVLATTTISTRLVAIVCKKFRFMSERPKGRPNEA
jgi:hypothetical protein